MDWLFATAVPALRSSERDGHVTFTGRYEAKLRASAFGIWAAAWWSAAATRRAAVVDDHIVGDCSSCGLEYNLQKVGTEGKAGKTPRLLHTSVPTASSSQSCQSGAELRASRVDENLESTLLFIASRRALSSTMMIEAAHDGELLTVVVNGIFGECSHVCMV